MKCASCGYQETVRKTEGLPYSYKGRVTTIPDVTADHCPSCGEIFLDYDESGRVSDAMEAFSREVNAALGYDPQFIRSARKKLGLGQKEASEIFGGGVNAFSRYETGKIAPPMALVKLLRILDAHPDLLPLAR